MQTNQAKFVNTQKFSNNSSYTFKLKQKCSPIMGNRELIKISLFTNASWPYKPGTN
jgi:hypothetical protein